MTEEEGGAGLPASPRRQTLDNAALGALMEEIFAVGGVFPFAPTGESMLPMLREHRDTVVLAGREGRPLRKYDVVLYRRAGSGQLVLHRIVGRARDGTLRLCGDHQTAVEGGIRPEQVLGVLLEFTRKGRTISAENRFYRCYAAAWVALRPLRRIITWPLRRIAAAGRGRRK